MSDDDVQPSTGPILGPHSPLPGRLILHHFKQQDKYTIRNFHTIRMLADYPICVSFHPSSSSTSWCTVGVPLLSNGDHPVLQCYLVAGGIVVL
jgi:hypothetical protein